MTSFEKPLAFPTAACRRPRFPECGRHKDRGPFGPAHRLRPRFRNPLSARPDERRQRRCRGERPDVFRGFMITGDLTTRRRGSDRFGHVNLRPGAERKGRADAGTLSRKWRRDAMTSANEVSSIHELTSDEMNLVAGVFLRASAVHQGGDGSAGCQDDDGQC